MECCGHPLTLADEKRLLDLELGGMRKADEEEDAQESPRGPTGKA